MALSLPLLKKKEEIMNMIQAMIILKNGIRKYGTIIEGEHNGRIRFIPATEVVANDESQLTNLIEHILVENIYSIDTFLK